MYHPSQWLIISIVAILTISLVARITFQFLGMNHIVDIIGNGTVILIGLLIAAVVVLYAVAVRKEKTLMRKQERPEDGSDRS